MLDGISDPPVDVIPVPPLGVTLLSPPDEVVSDPPLDAPVLLCPEEELAV